MAITNTNITDTNKTKQTLWPQSESVMVSGTHLGLATNFAPTFLNCFKTVTDLLVWGAFSDEKSDL
jgi:hypothetical protein